ncbi:RagB/SusD family nutrient uptake outer membrane protein [Rapidithrix thailandica]|uniref:RagB/SusD family nutrient uptake outer membrane protein n=1 Tax=Rapidithrix thailandica TaxID=413964 RepID=A0AAW9RSA7_9BACT
MKILKYTTILLGLLMTLLTGCNDDFLQRDPQTDITPELFFQNPNDLEIYTNGMYSQLKFSYEDIGSDNIAFYSGNSEADQILIGNVNAANAGGWSKDDWADLRKINFMLERMDQVQGNAEEIKNYEGIARFFRAWFYFGKVQRYSDVPWYSESIEASDEALIYKAKDPRAVVVDSIMADLEYAVENIIVNDDNTRVTRWAALTLLARFALYEGTFRKYHEELSLTGDYERFLKRAVSASEEIMENGGFSIHSTGNGVQDYRELFVGTTLGSNNEMILWANYDRDLGRGNNSHTVFDWQWALSRSLADAYLMKDGTPFTSTPDFDKKSFTQVFDNRDPRMMETIGYPGFVNAGSTEPFRIKPTFGGYNQLKFNPRDAALRQGWDANYTDLPVFRYAEVLLIYAEAKAELGTLAQSDIDKTVNVIRARVNMPALDMNAANAQVDPVQAARYPNVMVANKGALLEIRRERRVEMACEGLRYMDLMRWKAGKLLEDGQEGMYVPALGAFDVTGDGEVDIAILESPDKLGPIAHLTKEEQDALSKYFLIDSDGAEQNFYLSEGTSGFIRFVRDKNITRDFVEPKYYYRPIPQQQLLLNPNLEQTIFWNN